MQHADFLVVACMLDLVPQPGIKPGAPALGARSLTHWTTREVPQSLKYLFSGALQKKFANPALYEEVKEGNALAKHLLIFKPFFYPEGSFSASKNSSNPIKTYNKILKYNKNLQGKK